MNQNSTYVNENTLNTTSGRPYQWERKGRRPFSNRFDHGEVGAGENGEDLGDSNKSKHCPGCVCSLKYCADCFRDVLQNDEPTKLEELKMWPLFSWKNLITALPLAILLFIIVNNVFSLGDYIWPCPKPELPIYLKMFMILRNTLNEIYWS